METMYNLDLKRYESRTFTPSSAVKKLPLHLRTAGMFCAARDYNTKRSGLDSCLIMHTLSGAGLLTYEGKEYRLKAGELAIIDCNVYQYYRTDPDAGEWTFNWVHLEGCGVLNYYELVKNARGNVFAFNPVIGGEDILEYFRTVPDNGTLADGLKICAAASALFEAILCEKPDDGSRPAANKKSTADLIAAHIREGFKNELTLDGLASKYYISKYYLIRLFKECAGITPHEYIINCRINHAKKLLKETTKSVYEICFESGFNNVNNFTKIFKSIVNVPPGEYRKQLYE